jgi:hypothetical protein
MNFFQWLCCICCFFVSCSSGYFSSLIFKRLDKDREAEEKDKARKKAKSKYVVKDHEKMSEMTTDDAYQPGAY